MSQLFRQIFSKGDPNTMILRTTHRALWLCRRCYASSTTTTAAAPPMLLKIRKDLKAAMQAKDANRLSVLRSLLTQTLNASKTSTPVNTDLQMLALLRKSANASRVASAEFKGAGRQDLAEKEDSQLNIIEEYANGVEKVEDGEIEAAVKEVVDKMKNEGATMQIGEAMKRVLAPEIMGDKPVARGDVAKIVKQVLLDSAK